MSQAPDRSSPAIGPPSPWRHVGRWWVPAAAGVLVLAWAGSGLYTVQPDEQGVVTRFGRLHLRGVKPGLHYALPRPIDRVYTPRITEVKRVDVGFTTLGEKSAEHRRSDLLTGDTNILKMMMVVQYKIRDPAAYLFETEAPHWLVERTVESAMSRLVASHRVDDVLTTAKGTIEVEAVSVAQALLDAYGAGVVLLGGSLQVVDPPIPVMDAFTEVAGAKKDSERLIDEAREYESRILPAARGEAQRIISKAEGVYADRVNRASGEASRFRDVLAEYRLAKDITRTRLYVEAMERLFSKMNVVVLDRAGGEGRSNVTIVEQ